MPFTAFVAEANRRITNPIARRLAGRISPFAIVEHRGRKSGKLFRTPVMAFPANDDMDFALTYGSYVEGVKYVLAEAGRTIEYRRQRIALTDPRLTRGSPTAEPFPWVVRSLLRLTNVRGFLRLRHVKLLRQF